MRFSSLKTPCQLALCISSIDSPQMSLPSCTDDYTDWSVICNLQLELSMSLTTVTVSASARLTGQNAPEHRCCSLPEAFESWAETPAEHKHDAWYLTANTWCCHCLVGNFLLKILGIWRVFVICPQHNLGSSLLAAAKEIKLNTIKFLDVGGVMSS